MVTVFYRNIRLLALTIILVLVWGTLSFQSLPRQEDPELVSRIAVVQTAYPGANAERVESLVSEVIESELSELEEIAVLSSDSRAGFSTISVELIDTIDDAQPVWAKVRNELDSAAARLPEGTSEPELDEAKVKAYTVITALTWNLPEEPNYAILSRYADELALRMRGINGTEEVETFGDPSEEIVVEVDGPNLAALGLSAQTLASRIRASDAKVTAGQLRSSQQSLSIEVQSELETLEQIRQIPIQTDSGQFARLSDIAQVSRGLQQPMTDIALVSDKPAITLGVLMESGLRIDQWATEVRAALAEFEKILPQGVQLETIFDQSGYVEERMDVLISNLVTGALLVVVVTLFTMGWRSAIVVGTALPITSLAVFGWMSVLGIPIHQMSVSGLIIALGLLIDNAIIAVDEIQIEMQQHGAKPAEAVARTVKYLKGPLLASTITTVAAFLPIYLLPGAAGEFVGSIALNVIMALLCSLALSLTVIAALAGRVLGRSQTKAKQLEQVDKTTPAVAIQRFLLRPGAWWTEGLSTPRLARPYQWSLRRTTARPLLAIALSFTIPLIGFISASTLSQQFFPAVNRDQLQIEVEFAPQSAIARTRQQIDQARDLILSHPNVEEIHWFIGESAPKFYYNFTGNRRNQSQYAQAMVQLNTEVNVEPIVRSLQTDLNAAFPAARMLVRQLQQGPPYDAPIELRIYGPNLDELRRLGLEARRILGTIPEVTITRDDLSESLPKLGLAIDEEQAQQSGLSNTAIAQQLDAYLEGSVGGSILEGTENLPVRVRLSNNNRADLSQIASLDLQAENGGSRSTDALGDFSLVPELVNISRRNEERVNIVQGFLAAGTLPSVVQIAFEEKLADFELPPGYRTEYGGEIAEQSQAVGNLLLYVPLLGIIMMAALVLSLGSFRQAGIVAFVGVGSVGMALFSLKLFGAVFGFMAIVGTLGLVGIAINDTVMVLSGLNENAEAKKGDRKAIAYVVNQSTRHVLTTTITTIAGFVPLLISGGPFWQPLAIAIAGGIGGSSILALYFVPAAYALIYRHRKRLTPSTDKQQTAMAR
ncbi:efflux RND transporter permease subunit [cf. Phormidesmis sp. LEGE 11477]|uniref:efflux RND transporter permease subunit n=1 Tax=cf. Phormidesmis sp. LEGE 11477 TaxID=1828680 RepID=UPI001881A826|nr:efflux RND transporter permease subunit [cf. Phormidesmis sp. LEGE 11477]MBE9063159.1 efflux RND transporter permease subunit [cf. Phormidesmis sp. LEGE 11477]